MNEIINVHDVDIEVKQYKGQRVVTLSDIDKVHNRPDGTAKRNFNQHRQHFIEGEDYFIVPSDEIRTNRVFSISDNDFRAKALITESGYLMLVKSFTDDLAWEVQRQLVNTYFKVQEVRDMMTDLSPQMQMLYGMLDQMAETERKANEAKQLADKALEVTENIKDAIRPIADDTWREDMNSKFNRIQKNTDIPFANLRTEMYGELERRAGCDLNARIRNKRIRMADSGCKKTEVNAINKMDVIADDKRLREIFSKIVTEYEIKYCA